MLVFPNYAKNYASTINKGLGGRIFGGGRLFQEIRYYFSDIPFFNSLSSE